MKKRIIILSILLFVFFVNFGISFGAEMPKIESANGLPGYEASGKGGDIGIIFVSSIISNIIQFVAVFAVFALILSGIIYMISGGNEEKTEKAKKWIIWSLVGVLLSISAWSIVKILNGITVG